MTLERFVNEHPVLSIEWGLDVALAELNRLRRRTKRLEQFKEILRTLLDKRATLEEFQEAVQAVIAPARTKRQKPDYTLGSFTGFTWKDPRATAKQAAEAFAATFWLRRRVIAEWKGGGCFRIKDDRGWYRPYAVVDGFEIWRVAEL